MSRQQANKSLFTVMLVVLLSCAGVSLPYPILAPLFLNEVSPLTTFAGLPPKILLGIVLAIYPLGMLIGSSVIGAASDIYGRKKVLIWSLAASTIGYLLSAIALIQENYLLFVLTRFLTGLSEGNISVAKAIAVDLSPVLDKTRTFSFINATGYAGWLVGPLAGGLMQPLGTSVAFWVAAIAILLSLISVITLLPKDPVKPINTINWSALFSQNNSFALLKEKQMRYMFYIYLTVTLGINAYYEFYPVFLVEMFSFTSPQLGYITAVVTSSMIACSVLLVTPLKRKIGLIKGSKIGLALIALLLLIHPWLGAQSVWLFYALTGAAIAIYNGLLPVYISERFNDIGQGQLMGLLTTTFSLSNVVIAILGSAIALVGSVYSILFGGILMVIALLAFINFTRS